MKLLIVMALSLLLCSCITINHVTYIHVERVLVGIDADL